MMMGQGHFNLGTKLFPKGAEVVRIHDSHVDWITWNPARGVYNWTNLDIQLAACAATGVAPMFTFCYTPPWAAQSMPTGTYPGIQNATSNRPPNLTYFTESVTALVAHVKGPNGKLLIRYWEAWNEPNALAFWCGTDSQLFEQQKALYQIVKAADPTAMVTIPTPCYNITKVDQVIDTYLTMGFQQYANIISFHGYFPNSTSGTAIGPTLDALNAVLAKHNCQHPLWDTEFGFSYTANMNPASPLIPVAQQRQWIIDAITIRIKKGITAAIWYQFDNPLFVGTLCDLTTGALNTAGQAWLDTYNVFHKRLPAILNLHQV